MPGLDDHIAVTGANGFVGRAIAAQLRLSGRRVRGLVRQVATVGDDMIVGNVGSDTDWRSGLQGVSQIVHCAARVHILRGPSKDLEAPFFETNTQGTLTLARQAASAGVRRFVFLSSIKVNGEGTAPSVAFTAADMPNPTGPYANSKARAEDGLRDLANDTGMEVVIIRPPLVYGSGVKGNFEAMTAYVRHGVPLPLGAVTRNKRSLVALDNLVDLVRVCLDRPEAANRTFLVSDDKDISTTDLLRSLGRAIGRPARLLPVPTSLLWGTAKILGASDVADRLLGSMQIDITETCRHLGWRPPVTMEEGLRRAVDEQHLAV